MGSLSVLAVSAFLNIVTFCGEPVYMTGLSEDGRLLVGSTKYIYGSPAAGLLFMEITDQLPVDEDGAPVVVYTEVDKLLGSYCPVEV